MKVPFNAKKVKEEIVQWIRDYYKEIPDAKFVLGISGGIDSSVCAALGAEALGKDRVIGILLPRGFQSDIDCSYELCGHLGISHRVVNIQEVMKSFYKSFSPEAPEKELPTIITYNTPARIRMAMIYAEAGRVEGRVVNTCNLSEDWVGYSTKFGDSAGDLSPLMMITKTEVKLLAKELKLPERLATKAPTDGLCGKTDEISFGFTYEMLDDYIRTGECDDEQIKAKIDRMHIANLHKLMPQMAHYEYYPENTVPVIKDAMDKIPEARVVADICELERKKTISSELEMVAGVIKRAMGNSKPFPIEFDSNEELQQEVVSVLRAKGYDLVAKHILKHETGTSYIHYTMTRLK